MAKVVITLKLAKLFIPFCITELQKREEKHFSYKNLLAVLFFPTFENQKKIRTDYEP